MQKSRMARKAARNRKKRLSRYDASVIRWLIFCFPAGLMMMWGDRCRWPRAVKSAISLTIAAAIVAVVLPQTLPPERSRGGVEIVSLVPTQEIQGPEPEIVEGDDSYQVYVPRYIPQATLVVEPTPTPVPVYVYCNNGGKFYHSKGCRYVRDDTPRVTMAQALNAGFKPCDKCGAPKE